MKAFIGNEKTDQVKEDTNDYEAWAREFRKLDS
jgi:hypothetical protein